VRFTLIGVDPGIIDTGAVSVTIDFSLRAVYVHTALWTGVSSRDKLDKQKIVVSDKFLDEIAGFVQNERANGGPTFVGIEGYRQRGYDKGQDQRMIDLIQTISRTLPKSKIVDNTGVRKTVKQGLLELLHLAKFKKGGNHSDLKSAARVALVLGIKDETINKLLTELVVDLVDGGSWSFASTRTV